jgi:predicted nucleotidyltransferase
MDPVQDPLLKVCSLLNEQGARYLVVGGYALILHGLVRTTEDVDLLVEDSEDNYRRVIAALSQLEDHAAAELTPADFTDNVVVKIADEIEVDVSRRAWKLSYTEAIPNAASVVIDGVRVPYVGLGDLIKSKDSYRGKDRLDLAQLQRLAQERGRTKKRKKEDRGQ